MMYQHAPKTWTIPCGPTTLTLGQRTVIMGILNVTPDSFSDGGQWINVEEAATHAKQMMADGADIIDIGGESTRPGHAPVDTDEELRRVLPVIRALREQVPNAIISIDTYKAQVADEALNAGANIINDIWGFLRDPDMAKVAARHQAPSIVMHNQDGTEYDDLIHDMIRSFRRSIRTAVAAGLPPELIIVDPGIGFGKTPIQNLDVLRDLGELRVLGRPILLATSRKSTIGKVLGNLPPDERLEGTAATVALGIAQGAEMVRVHDVKAMKRVAVMTDAIVRPGRGGFTGE
ncbi:MAG: dihydropteroate synthase [Symbiobacteriaceae bacterium]|jgi:dihydropteroate synthase|nr:dihydropteroate synthase [Symbiobacteriaceae bacterium]